jgi:hypothetical protein
MLCFIFADLYSLQEKKIQSFFTLKFYDAVHYLDKL